MYVLHTVYKEYTGIYIDTNLCASSQHSAAIFSLATYSSDGNGLSPLIVLVDISDVLLLL